MKIDGIISKKPYIICEIGSNWNTLEDCLNSITEAKTCGADCVKFQIYDEITLYGMECEAHYVSHNETGEAWSGDEKGKCISNYPKELAGKLFYFRCPPESHFIKGGKYTLLQYLEKEWLPKLKEKADAVGIEFMCSAFSPELLEVIDPYVNIHKLASAELTHVRMLEKLSVFGKPILMSTGGQTLSDIDKALTYIHDTSQVILMHCISAYPARDSMLECIPAMEKYFKLPVGFSDHSLDISTIPRIAVASGAVVIEKHVNFVGTQGSDAPHSLSGVEFKQMCAYLHGDATISRPSPEENAMVTRHKRRLLAIKDIKAGDTLIEGQNFGIYRSLKDETRAASPYLINEFIGRSVKVDIKAGDGIWIDDLSS